MNNEIKDLIMKLGADVCGIASIERFIDAPKGFHPTDIYPECNSAIVYGIALPKGLTKVDPSLIYGHYNDIAAQQVDLIAFKVAKIIEEKYCGIAVPMPCDGPYEYWDGERMEGRGLLSMKHAAVLAGLGTIGKSTLLINKKYGNLLTIGVILTDLTLEADPLAESICLASCSLCIDSCPANALDGIGANQMNCRQNTYSTNARGFSTVNCNVCRSVCPMKYGSR